MVSKWQHLDVTLVCLSSALGPPPGPCSATHEGRGVSSSLGCAVYCPCDCSEVLSSLCIFVFVPAQQELQPGQAEGTNGSRTQARLGPCPGKRGEKGRDGEHCQLANLTGTLEAGKVEYLSQSPLRLGIAI